MNLLIIYQEGCQDLAMPSIREILKGHKISCIERDSISAESYQGKDLILVLGGDGTFMRASHLNGDIPMMGINPKPGSKEGFYMQADINDYKAKLKKLIAKQYRIIELLRLGVDINDKQVKELVLNEVFIGDRKPYTVFNYEIEIQGKKEFHRSSGLLVGTPSGSNAWIRSAGGIAMPLEEKKFQYISREPYIGKLTPYYEMAQGILDQTGHLNVYPKSQGIIVIDSISTEYEITTEDSICISAKTPLRYIVF